MLNPSILDGWEDYTLAKQLYLAKAATITGAHPETRVKEEAPMWSSGSTHQELREILQLF